jgi:hypothetical protein
MPTRKCAEIEEIYMTNVWNPIQCHKFIGKKNQLKKIIIFPLVSAINLNVYLLPKKCAKFHLPIAVKEDNWQLW